MVNSKQMIIICSLGVMNWFSILKCPLFLSLELTTWDNPPNLPLLMSIIFFLSLLHPNFSKNPQSLLNPKGINPLLKARWGGIGNLPCPLAPVLLRLPTEPAVQDWFGSLRWTRLSSLLSSLLEVYHALHLGCLGIHISVRINRFIFWSWIRNPAWVTGLRNMSDRDHKLGQTSSFPVIMDS